MRRIYFYLLLSLLCATGGGFAAGVDGAISCALLSVFPCGLCEWIRFGLTPSGTYPREFEIIFPLGIATLGGAIIGGALMSHTPLLYDSDWVPGGFIGGTILWVGTLSAVSIHKNAIRETASSVPSAPSRPKGGRPCAD